MKKNAVENALESLKLAKIELERQLADVTQAIKSLSGDEEYDAPNSQIVSNRQIVTSKDGYDREWSHADKFIHFLKKENRFLHLREVSEMVVKSEGGDVKQVIDKITSGTGHLRKNGTIVKIQASNMLRDTFWGSPKWLDAEGNILNGHEFNPDYLYQSDKAKSLIEI